MTNPLVTNPMTTRRDRDRSFKRAVTLFFLFSMLLVLGTIWLGNTPINPFENKYRLHFSTSHVLGIQIETPVTLAGIMIGKVVSMEFSTHNQIQVGMRLLKRYQDKIRTDSRITFNQPMVGNSSLDISLGSKQQPMLQEGDYLPLERSREIGDLVERFSPILDNLDRTMKHLAQLSGQWMEPDEPFQQILQQAVQLTAHTVRLMEGLQTRLPPMLDRMDQSVGRSLRQADGLLLDARKGVQAVPPLMGKVEGVVERTQEILSNLVIISRQLEKLTPKVPALVQQGQDVMDEAEMLMRNLNHSILFDDPRMDPEQWRIPLITPRDVPLSIPRMP
ncbi:MAG: MCE family protein [Magnetococcales bacterium]|nr:MCE family protein [Magnetococcales bacterium]